MDRLYKLFEEFSGKAVTETEELGSSGSDRRYFRLKGGNISVIGVIGTNLDENKAFMTLSKHLLDKGLNVPEVYGVSEDGMCYIQEDLGGESLYDAVSKGRESGEYDSVEAELLCRTIAKLPSIQFRGAEDLDWSVCFPEPEFNGRMVLFDLNYFKYCFLKTTGLDFNEVRLQEDFEALKEDLTKDAGCTFMYRDFQARNVMLKDGEPYFIDFQGGRRGPIYYDVASFVWQAKSRYQDELRKRLVATYIEALKEYVDVDEAEFNERLRLFVLFRTLQVLGAYGFRGYFEKKPHFLGSIPFAVKNLRSLLEKPFEDYPYLNSLLVELVNMPQFVGQAKLLPAPVVEAEARKLEVEIFSFSFKKGIPADTSGNGGGYVFDCRAVNNPGRYEYYRQFTGLDREVVKFLEDDGGAGIFLNNIYSLIDSHVRCFIDRKFSHLQVSFGCTGGQHRSVYCAERLAERLASEFDVTVKLTHRELGIGKTLQSRKS